MTLGSLFDGIGGFPLSGLMHGITPVWASEIEPFPILVTSKRFPGMKHLGSVTDINGAEIEPVDIITFGSPCQDLSVAGLQKGIHDGERSNLFFEAIRIIKEMRAHDRAAGRTDEHVRCRWAVWENVPGALSSQKGADFRAVLQSLCEVADPEAYVPLPEKGKWSKAGCVVGDGYSVAWRTYDAQYWGVPQRRKRIYLVADFAGERAGEILFERESMRGNPAEGGEAREGTAEDAPGSAGGSSLFEPRSLMEENWAEQNVKNALRANASKSSHAVVGAFMGGQGEKAGGIGYAEGVAPTIKAAPSLTNQVPDVVYQNTGVGWWNEAQVAETLRTPCGGDSTKANLVVYPAASRTLTAEHDASPCVDRGQNIVCIEGNGHPGSYTGQDAYNDMLPVIPSDKPPRKYIVRRLTPLECCRLQGYPDGWTENLGTQDPTEEQIEFFMGVWETWAKINGTKPKSRNQVVKWLADPQSDSAEYKAYGNSLAIPCSSDVLGKIARAISREREKDTKA